MKLPRELSISDLLGRIRQREYSAFIRMALTHRKALSWTCRSLVIDLFPKDWTDNPGQIFAAYRPPDIAPVRFDNSALFLLQEVRHSKIYQWFEKPAEEITYTEFDLTPGHRTEDLHFGLPTFQTVLNGSRLYSDQDDGFPILPWPHFAYRFFLTGENMSYPEDSEQLYIPRAYKFNSLREARANLIHDIRGAKLSSYFDRDQMEIRIIDEDGWISSAESVSDGFNITVGGTALDPGTLDVLHNHEIVGSGDVHGAKTVHVSTPSGLSLVTISLGNDRQVLDERQYRFLSVSDSASAETAQSGNPGDAGDAGGSSEGSGEPRKRQQDRPKQSLRVIVASPSDVQDERDSLPDVLSELNETTAGLLGIELRLWKWETDSYPKFHLKGPQGQIDDTMEIEDSYIVIGVFWSRFGTPVEDAQSGTEHELQRAIAAWKQHERPNIMLYFRNEAISNPDPVQLGALKAFKDRHKAHGLWWSYKDPQEFANLVRRHIARLLLDQFSNGS